MRLFKKVIKYILVLIVMILILNIPMTTRQGIDGIVFTRKISLYAKISGFLYRDHQYKYLCRQIMDGIQDDTDKVTAIYDWTIENIKRPPKGFPIVDDHIWDIIVRGYGANDQMADVFTTLASYAGYKSFRYMFHINSALPKLILSFVEIGNNWLIFDVYNKKYFTYEEALTLPTPYGPTYGEYLKAPDEKSLELCIERPNKQKVLQRLAYEFKKIFLRKN